MRWQHTARFAPLAALLALTVLLYLGFTLRDPHLLPSALLNKPFPPFDLPVLGATPERASRADLIGQTRLVNVWATWCPTYLAEHGELQRIRTATGLSIIGINYKDEADDALAWLARHGDPYDFHIVDAQGDLGVELGVYGAPETFLVDAEGVIRYKRVGDVNPAIWRDELQPALRTLAAGTPATR